MLRTLVMQLQERVNALDRLMEAKFVTMETLMRYQAEKVALALDASKEAINKADVADEKARDRLADDLTSRFNSVNELRGALSDSQTNNMPRTEFEAFRKSFETSVSQMREQHTDQIGDLKERLDKAQGGFSGIWGFVVAFGGVAVAIWALVVK